VTVIARVLLREGTKLLAVSCWDGPGRRCGRGPRCVAEATGGRWLRVRIDCREHSIPLDVAEGVLIDVPEAAQPPPAADAALDAAAFRARYRLPP
jgi:hypothetical protein